MKLLAVNPGSTSTKVAVYEDKERILSESLEHSAESFSCFNSIAEQLPIRKDAILRFLKKGNIELSTMDAVVGRGGILPPVQSGAYRINDCMVERLKNQPVSEHASNLGALIAHELAKPCNIPAFIYDPVSVDELQEIARITGIPEVRRKSQIHALNMRAAAIKTAEELRRPYAETTLIVAHLGGGISLSLHHCGKMIDVFSDDEGPFAPERSGRIPALLLSELCYSGLYSRNEMIKKIRGGAGLKAHLGTNSTKEVEDRIRQGDEKAKMIYSAMAYTVAKAIGELATVACGKVDRIVLTGGIAYSEMFTGWVRERIEFIAPVVIIGGENEMEALALGALRVLSGDEQAKEYEE